MLHCNDTICSPAENRGCARWLPRVNIARRVAEGWTGDAGGSPTVRINVGSYHARLKLRKEEIWWKKRGLRWWRRGVTERVRVGVRSLNYTFEMALAKCFGDSLVNMSLFYCGEGENLEKREWDKKTKRGLFWQTCLHQMCATQGLMSQISLNYRLSLSCPVCFPA